MKRLVLLILCIMLLLASCITENAETKDIEQADDASQQQATEEKGTDDPDMQKLADMLALSKEMINFLEEGLDKLDSDNWNMEFADYRVCDSIIEGLYLNYNREHEAYSETDDAENQLYVVTKISKEGRTYSYNNIMYDYVERDKEIMLTDITYYGDKNLLVHTGNMNAPDSISIDKYFMTDDGKLFIVKSHLLMNNLYLSVLYYDGGFIGVASWSVDDQSEITLPYDLEQMQPTSFEDMLTVESFDRYFTYDGVNVKTD
ncbi:MAG: hypothetical protein AB1Z23_12425 [Eubacteriales bacterium]